MISRSDDYPDNFSHQADICIIGTGVAGLMIARELKESRLSIVMLEGGDWEASASGHELFAGEIENGCKYRGLLEGRSRKFGGTTGLWGGQCIRLDPSDFEARSWIPHSGWPIRYDDLVRFYEIAEARLGIAPREFRSEIWHRFGLTSPEFEASKLRTVHGVFIRRSDLGRRFRAEFKASNDIHVILQANVTNIVTNSSGRRISGVDFKSINGIRGSVRATAVILCAGGIENARLLLLSNEQNPRGLGNDKDLVGRYLQDHPCGRSAEIKADHPRYLQDHFNMLYGRQAKYLPKLAVSENAQKQHEILNCVGRLVYEYPPASGIQALRDVVTDLRSGGWPRHLPTRLVRMGKSAPTLAQSAWRFLYKGLSPAPHPAKIYLETFSEQTPNPASRVSLSSLRDRLGLRKVKIDWQLDTLTGETFRKFTTFVAGEFSRLGLASLREADWLECAVPPFPEVIDSFHPAGTTRMALTPDGGVVDTNSMVFGINGLFVAGSSTFPTSGAANPTLTIAAMALRLALHVKESMRESSKSTPCLQKVGLTKTKQHERVSVRPNVSIAAVSKS
jgi:choline dehydrogenase-like flavoprotein